LIEIKDGASDALSARGGPATSYLKMFEHNLTTPLTALKPSM